MLEGVLTCDSCKERFPIVDAIPRLCRDLAESEKEALERYAELSEVIVEGQEEEIADRYGEIERIVRERVAVPDDATEYLKKRAETELEFRVRACELQEKYVRTLKCHYDSRPETLIDIGGGQGGLVKCFNERLRPSLSVMIDRDLKWVDVAKLRNPDVEIVRADAVSIPFRSDSFDVVLSQAMLEHVADHDSALGEMCRITKSVMFLCWGPNKFFLYDLGHLDAPVTVLPKPLGRWVALIWHRLRRTGRTMETIDEGLGRTFYISTRHVKRFLRRFGRVQNVFASFMTFSLQSEYSYSLHGTRGYMKRHPSLTNFILRAMVALRVEPNGYYIMLKDKTAPATHSGGRSANKEAPADRDSIV